MRTGKLLPLAFFTSEQQSKQLPLTGCLKLLISFMRRYSMYVLPVTIDYNAQQNSDVEIMASNV